MPATGSLYFLREELLPEFRDELKKTGQTVRELAPGIFFSEQVHRLFWVLDYWPCQRVEFSSISDAARQLRRLSRKWSYAGGLAFRRGQLIADELRVKPLKRLHFPVAEPAAGFSAFTLGGQNEIFWSDQPLKGYYAGGQLRFEEDRVGPPSRAYLKLQEALTLAGLSISASDNVLDLGATPGGWTYVAAAQGAHVDMVDRTPPDSALLAKFTKVRFHRADGLAPADDLLQAASVLLSDMACEPAKLIESVKAWQQLPNLRFMVCTLKFHGMSDKALVGRFAAMQGAQVYHLWHNGHELTWIWSRP